MSKVIKFLLRLFSEGIKLIVRFIFKLSTLGLRCGMHITRYYMYEHLSFVLKALGEFAPDKKVLSISESKGICDLFNLKNSQIIEANFPEYNMLQLPFKDNEFDVVVSDQVLEHVEGDPQQAIDESYRVLKPGGIVVHTTCFVYLYHAWPKDFWRFSPDALQLLCKKFSKIIDVGGWGNFWVWVMSGFGLRFYPIPHARWHPLHKLAILNNKKWPVITWVVAQK